MTEKRYQFHGDPGHGWLAVPIADLETLGIKHRISPCSYYGRADDLAYLEEDCDYTFFMHHATKVAGWTVYVKEHYARGDSFVRRLPAWPMTTEYDLHRNMAEVYGKA